MSLTEKLAICHHHLSRPYMKHRNAGWGEEGRCLHGQKNVFFLASFLKITELFPKKFSLSYISSKQKLILNS